MLNKESAKDVLQLTTTVLEEAGITYWIDSGTLLSAYRDKDINQYDHDIDIRTCVEQFPDSVLAEMIGRFWLAGFRGFMDDKPIKAQILMWHPAEVLVDLKLCYHDGEHLWYYCWNEPEPKPMLHVYPMKYFNLGKIELLGREYPCPQPVEDYLVHHYGEEWRLFKCRPEDTEVTDLTWDYMKDPLCSMTQEEFRELKKEKVNA